MQVISNTVVYDPAASTIKGVVEFAASTEATMLNWVQPIPDFTVKAFSGGYQLHLKGETLSTPVGAMWTIKVCEASEEDANADGVVDGADLGVMLAAAVAFDGHQLGKLLAAFGKVEKVLASTSGSMTGVGFMPLAPTLATTVIPASVPMGCLRFQATISKNTAVTLAFNLQL